MPLSNRFMQSVDLNRDGVLLMRSFEINVVMIKGQQWISDFEQRQRRLTATMCVACAFTLFLYVIPVCIDLSLGGTTDVLTSNILSIYTAISTNLSPFTNIVVIAMRHLDIKEQLISVSPAIVTKCCS
ncbi:unnamed protein product [Toxocara canis]|uniref:G_PROTEIN_RECEP_F1_2 domain-containing protein n=1 Tax=Toxocara canis TaxID=6265 RepID=A0A183V062_TOXCA|nr:unnamed protein product [Toxocara canis]